MGVLEEQQPNDIFSQQLQYAPDILEHVGMSDCKPCDMPVYT
jgi:hypothetical protein